MKKSLNSQKEQPWGKNAVATKTLDERIKYKYLRLESAKYTKSFLPSFLNRMSHQYQTFLHLRHIILLAFKHLINKDCKFLRVAIVRLLPPFMFFSSRLSFCSKYYSKRCGFIFIVL